MRERIIDPRVIAELRRRYPHDDEATLAYLADKSFLGAQLALGFAWADFRAAVRAGLPPVLRPVHDAIVRLLDWLEA